MRRLNSGMFYKNVQDAAPGDRAVLLAISGKHDAGVKVGGQFDQREGISRPQLSRFIDPKSTAPCLGLEFLVGQEPSDRVCILESLFAKHNARGHCGRGDEDDFVAQKRTEDLSEPAVD